MRSNALMKAGSTSKSEQAVEGCTKPNSEDTTTFLVT